MPFSSRCGFSAALKRVRDAVVLHHVDYESKKAVARSHSSRAQGEAPSQYRYCTFFSGHISKGRASKTRPRYRSSNPILTDIKQIRVHHLQYSNKQAFT